MSLFAAIPDDSIFFSRSDTESLLGSWAPYAFRLEGQEWPTVEHYFQALKFREAEYQERIRAAKSPKEARKLGRSKRQPLREDWKKVREVVLTRAIYTRARTYNQLAAALLETGDKTLVENNAYDYFWGCGRDRRGENRYGKVLMKVRARLREEAAGEAESRQQPGGQ